MLCREVVSHIGIFFYYILALTHEPKACRLVFIASRIGTRDFSSHIKILRGNRPTNPALPELRRVVCLGNDAIRQTGVEMQSYNTFASNGNSVFMNDHVLKRAENNVTPDDVLNLQFTSGMSRQSLG